MNSNSGRLRLEIALVLAFIIIESLVVSFWPGETKRSTQPREGGNAFTSANSNGDRRVEVTSRVHFDEYLQLSTKRKKFQRYYSNEFVLSPALKMSLNEALRKAAVERKTIIVWHNEDAQTERAARFAKYANEQNQKDECGSCWFTTDKKRIDDANCAAIVFLYKYVSPGSLPRNRRLDQMHVWFSNESPANLRYSKNYNLNFEDVYKFNATMGYRHDANIFLPYGGIETYRNLRASNLSWILTTKTQWAVAVVSNCDSFRTATRRLTYIKEILAASNGRLHTVGKCFDNRVGDKGDHSLDDFLQHFKFFLAFENSYHCREYITEKFFDNALKNNVVPVVWGATKEDYIAIAPHNSFIYAEDFPTAENLVSYLFYLDKNDTAYLEYFRWRLKDLPGKLLGNERKTGTCQLCRIVHGINVDDLDRLNSSSHSRPPIAKKMSKRTLSQPLSEWYYGTENADCI